MGRKLNWLILALACTFTAAGAEIPFRGVVEGYYGRPWGTEGRLSILKFMGETGLNTFIYGPKDDPYHHAKWREPYPAKERADFARLLACARANKVNLYWAIHLGGGFRKSQAAEDYAALFRKLESMYALGFRGFAAFFDDFGKADAAFHAEICNRIQSEFLAKKGDCAPLVMCPNVYWGSGRPYQKTIGEKLDKSIRILWTGAGICHDINAKDVTKITADFQRAPFIWWNWPVNDYCRKKLLLGRTYGLDDCPYAGFVSNPMENCEANKLALFGIAAWAKDPAHFDSRATWEASFAKLYPDPAIARAMRVFAEHNSDQDANGHGYRREESVAAAPLCASVREAYRKDGRLSSETVRKLAALFTEVDQASATLLKKLDLKQGLGWEIQGWLEVERAQMQQGLAALDLMRGTRSADTCVRAIRAARVASAQAATAHIAKFRAATFPNDRGNVKAPEASTRELKPTVELLLTGELRKLYQKRTGKTFEEQSGFQALSGARSMAQLTVSRTGKYAGLDKILEQREIGPNEWFGLAVPQSWQTTYVHLNLEDADAVRAGVVEVSKDGRTWEKLDTQNKSTEMRTPLRPNAGWRQVRYRNISTSPVRVKVSLFKFDVKGEASPIDALLEKLSRQY